MHFPKGPGWSEAKPGVEPKRAAFRGHAWNHMPQERASEEVITLGLGVSPTSAVTTPSPATPISGNVLRALTAFQVL